MSHEKGQRCCCCCTKRTCCGVSVQIFFIVLIIGILCLALVPFLIHHQIEEMLSLESPTAGLYQTWRNGTAKQVVVKNVYHFYHLKNPWEVENLGATPDLDIKGPYTYLHVKFRPEGYTRWHADGTVEYRDLILNYFVPDESVPNGENDIICTPRTGIFMAMQQGASYGIEFLMIDVIKKANVTSFFQNKSVFDLVHGYDEPVLQDLAIIGVSPIVAFDPNTTDATTVTPDRIYSGGEASTTQPPVPDNSLGSFTMVSGMKKLNYWGSDYANTIMGTDATVYPPFIMLDTGRLLYAYVSDISRSIILTYTGKHTEEGIPVHRYRLDPSLFYNSTMDPANAAYYITHTGLQPTTPCKNASTGKGLTPDWIFAAISKAMFLDADMNDINVKLPREANRDLDDITLDYEPITSTLIEAHKRLQLNLRIRPIEALNFTKNYPRSWFPVFRYDETAVLPQKDRDTLKNDVLIPLIAVLVVGIIATVVGFFGFCISLCQYCTARSADQEKEKSGIVNSNVRNASWTANGRELNYATNDDHHARQPEA